ncbi:hypothetical protein E0500_005580 [Streptomyces sp. KM273126]|nr:hypothetical protein [Streptomyces sp. KM273126]
MDKEAITARLTQDQAFMLSDWLYQVRFQSDDLEGIMHNRAVWSPIYAIPGTLDKTLSEVFMPDYGLRLEAAKERLRADLYGGAGESTAPGQSTTDAPQAHQIERGTAGNHRERSQARRSHPSAVRSGQQPNGLE